MDILFLINIIPDDINTIKLNALNNAIDIYNLSKNTPNILESLNNN